MAESYDVDWELRLGFLIHDVSRLRRSAFDRVLKPLNVTRAQWWMLAYLSREDGMTQSQLAVGEIASLGPVPGLAGQLGYQDPVSLRTIIDHEF